MNARERVIKTINHEEPDRVPSYEGSIDSKIILEHYGEKYGVDDLANIQKTLYNQFSGDIKLLNKYFYGVVGYVLVWCGTVGSVLVKWGAIW